MALELTEEQKATGWQVKKLGDLCKSIDYGLTASATEKNTGTKFLRITDIKSGYCDDSSVPFVELSDDERRKYLLHAGDIVIARTGATTGISAWLKNPKNTVFASYLVRFTVKDGEHNSRFIGYLLKTDIFQRYIYSVLAEKSAQPNASATTIANAELPVPSRDEQDRIAEILGSVDDKIEANSRLLESLSELGDALIKKLISESSENIMLSEIADIAMGQSPSGDSLNEIGNGTVFYQGRRDFGFRYPAERVYTTAPTRMAAAEDILLSVRAPVGDLNRVDKACCVGRGVAAIRAKDGNTSQLFYLLKNSPQLWEPFEGEGTIFSSINRKQVNELMVPLVKSDGEFTHIEATIKGLTHEIRNLEKIREFLIHHLIG
ncbi:MAG TPA: restriction endonuclease subunit S [Candidatus Rothia avicola]|uniref:Restriction endonuclease subunit S n=1 Tax=Candidatus Rothia avicola TaxID=2840478 RepID=A0A9D2CQZ5_9MICC|nr:restriction endonuclease subunit S [Candidatus Rothia avicola]